jgi:putative nucleotidyltransferase with HDIG domain
MSVNSVVSQRPVEFEQLVEESRARVTRSLRTRERLTTAASAFLFLTVALPLALFAPTTRPAALIAWAVLIPAYAFASRVEFEIGIGAAIPTQLVFVPMLFLLPAKLVPLAVTAGLLCGAFPEIARRRFHPDQLLVQLANGWHALGPALVIVIAGEPAARLDHWPWAVLLLAVVSQLAFDFASSAARGRFAFGIPLREQADFLGPVYLVDVILTPVGLAIAIASSNHPLGTLVGVPLIGLLGYFARERQRRIDHALELSGAYRGTAFLLGDVVEADDPYTGSHSRDVVELVLAVADELRLPPRERRLAELAALLHDVGKIRIPNNILNKPGGLTTQERAIIETHTIEGEQLLARVGGMLGEVGQIVRSCHERWDGNGYPDGLANDSIPLIARIVMACDALNAMTTDRSYRKALTHAEALAELRRNSGAQFDPTVVNALLTRAPAQVPQQAPRNPEGSPGRLALVGAHVQE